VQIIIFYKKIQTGNSLIQIYSMYCYHRTQSRNNNTASLKTTE